MFYQQEPPHRANSMLRMNWLYRNIGFGNRVEIALDIDNIYKKTLSYCTEQDHRQDTTTIKSFDASHIFNSTKELYLCSERIGLYRRGKNNDLNWNREKHNMWNIRIYWKQAFALVWDVFLFCLFIFDTIERIETKRNNPASRSAILWKSRNDCPNFCIQKNLGVVSSDWWSVISDHAMCICLEDFRYFYTLFLQFHTTNDSCSGIAYFYAVVFFIWNQISIVNAQNVSIYCVHGVLRRAYEACYSINVILFHAW